MSTESVHTRTLTIPFETSVHRRLTHVAKKMLHMTTRTFVQQATIEKMELVERKAEWREAEKQRLKEEQAARRQAQRQRLALGVDKPSAAVPTVGESNSNITVMGHEFDPELLAEQDRFYAVQAASIAEGDPDPTELKRRVRIAIIAVTREFPLSRPVDDATIVTGIERHLRLQRAAPATSATPNTPPAEPAPVDNVLEIDVTNLPTRTARLTPPPQTPTEEEPQ